MNALLDKYSVWAALCERTPGYGALAHAIGHREKKHDCLARRQGLCPGLEYCHDCAWSEGNSRQG